MALLRTRLGYGYWGNLKDQDNGNVNEAVLREFLANKQKLTPNQISGAIAKLKQAAHCASKSALYNANKDVYRMLRFPMPIPTEPGKPQKQAFRWFLTAYINDQGHHPEACYKLGDCYRYGRGTIQNLKTAFILYKQAYAASWSPKRTSFAPIDHGWDNRLKGADSALRLADCHRFGLGTEIDRKQAKHYYLIALAGFKRKMELLDPFAEALYNSVRCSLAELRRWTKRDSLYT